MNLSEKEKWELGECLPCVLWAMTSALGTDAKWSQGTGSFPGVGHLPLTPASINATLLEKELSPSFDPEKQSSQFPLLLTEGSQIKMGWGLCTATWIFPFLQENLGVFLSLSEAWGFSSLAASLTPISRTVIRERKLETVSIWRTSPRIIAMTHGEHKWKTGS